MKHTAAACDERAPETLSAVTGIVDVMSWLGDGVRDTRQLEAYGAVQDLASWWDWLPFEDAVAMAPREPGVYLLRDPASHAIVYAGMAGERAGSGRPQGLYGRLSVYRTGKGAVSGFGEAALDRALADPAWVHMQLEHLREGRPKRAKVWAADAVRRFAPEISWAVRAERADAKFLETEVVLMLRPFGLWNR